MLTGCDPKILIEPQHKHGCTTPEIYRLLCKCGWYARVIDTPKWRELSGYAILSVRSKNTSGLHSILVDLDTQQIFDPSPSITYNDSEYWTLDAVEVIYCIDTNSSNFEEQLYVFDYR